METVVGIFTSRAEAERAADRLRAIGILQENINFLTPGASTKDLDDAPTTETEQPGMGKALGGVVGGAIGLASGAQIATAAATALLPGVGPVIAIGMIGGALLGIGGAVGGALVGGAVEDTMDTGLPQDELFVYEDALRQGRTVVIALAEDDDQAERVQNVLAQAGAESVDAAREKWWVGLRDAEEEEYTSPNGAFRKDEPTYRRGFEAALHRDMRGQSYEEVTSTLRQRYPDLYKEPAFRRGFERGQLYYQRLLQQQVISPNTHLSA